MLPRSAGGLPVPYVARWVGEEALRIRPCRFARGQFALFARESWVGRSPPLFGWMDPRRQREVVRLGRCQVCRVMLPRLGGRGVRWLVDFLVAPIVGRPETFVSFEPWTCAECLRYALRVCPGMLRASCPGWPVGALVDVLAVRDARVVVTVVQPEGVLTGRPPCVSYLAIEPLEFVRVPAETFLELGPEAALESLGEPVRVAA